MVTGWWQGYMINGNSDFILIRKLRNLQKDITKWNKEVYGKLETRKSKIFDELAILEQATENRVPA